MNTSDRRQSDIEQPMQLSTTQLEEFKAEGALPIPDLVRPDVIAGWQDRFRAACSDGLDLDVPHSWTSGRYTPAPCSRRGCGDCPCQ